MELPDNPWAYPTAEWTRDGEHVREHHGMTLRDYFAGRALTGIMAAPQTDGLSSGFVSRWAYDIANAMLKERTK